MKDKQPMTNEPIQSLNTERVSRVFDMTGKDMGDKAKVRENISGFIHGEGSELRRNYSRMPNELSSINIAGQYIDLVFGGKTVFVAVEPQPVPGGRGTYVEEIVATDGTMMDGNEIFSGTAVIKDFKTAVVVRRVETRPNGSNLAGYRVYVVEGSSEAEKVGEFFGYNDKTKKGANG